MVFVAIIDDMMWESSQFEWASEMMRYMGVRDDEEHVTHA